MTNQDPTLPQDDHPLIERRKFVSIISKGLLGLTAIPPLLPAYLAAQKYNPKPNDGKTCWLDVCAPFIFEDHAGGVHTEIVLTSDTFFGVDGYTTGEDETEYEIYLYDAGGNAIGTDGVAKSLTVGAMNTTVLSVRDLIGERKEFFGGMVVRLRPKGRTPMHASDLFSSAFVRWTTDSSFDNVHANPDPLQWKIAKSFFYSMPFPPLEDYDCVYSVFNPYSSPSKGAITIYNSLGSKLKEAPYNLRPYSSLIFSLRDGEIMADVRNPFTGVIEPGNGQNGRDLTRDGGSIAVTNNNGSVKNFGYLLIRRKGQKRFGVEHPIHQPPFDPVKAPRPIDKQGRLKAKTILYTPLLFRSRKIGGLTLDTRFHLSSGAPMEENLWLSPFVTDSEGSIAWQITPETTLPSSISKKQIENGVVKLGGRQSCVFDCAKIKLPENFSGGFSLAVAPASNHTLMKVEVTVKEWGAFAFTHFRPGLQAARAYQKQAPRGGLATDYITSGARLQRKGNSISRDEIIAIINIDDQSLEGKPILEVFTSSGLMTKIELGEVPAFACKHYLLSELMPDKSIEEDMTLRLVDAKATLLMSVLHLDYERKDIAMDHGSDRFSTFQDFNCEA